MLYLFLIALNYLNASSIEDVKHYSTTTSSTRALPIGEITEFPYYSPNDIQYANTWEHEQFDYKINHLVHSIHKYHNKVKILLIKK